MQDIIKKLYGGKIILNSKTTQVNINKRSDLDDDDDDYVDSCEYNTETKFYLLNVDKEERLINGFTPIKDIIYCMQKL